VRQNRTIKSIAAIFLMLLVLILPGMTSCNRPTSAVSSNPQPKAAIVDQLDVLEHNPEFISKATAILESAGYQVDLWQGKAVTVDFYRHLAEQGYKLIIMRVHSGILLSMNGSTPTPTDRTYLFTGETYSTSKYVSEQLTDKVSNAMMTDKYPLVFAVNSQFIEDDFKGNFHGAAIISMGCESYYQDDMASAFLKKGASVYVGWSTVVSLDYVETATINLMDNLIKDNQSVEQGTAGTMAEVGTDPYFKASLKYFPAGSGNQTISNLIK
jgi:hypothetical protein